MDSLSPDVSKTRLHAFWVTRIGQTQVICSTEDELIYIWYPVLHRTSDRNSQTIPWNPCCIVQWQPTKHQASLGRLLRTKQQASFCHSANCGTPVSWVLHAFLVSLVWHSRTFLSSCNIQLALHTATYSLLPYSTFQNSIAWHLLSLAQRQILFASSEILQKSKFFLFTYSAMS